MPLIAQDYWVSNFFGNTMYLLALSYYFVITFLGYNGKLGGLSRCEECPSTDLEPHFSSPVSQPHRGPTCANSRSRGVVANKLIHVRLRDYFGPCSVVWSALEETCMIKIWHKMMHFALNVLCMAWEGINELKKIQKWTSSM